jgi:invasion protein IalB
MTIRSTEEIMNWTLRLLAVAFFLLFASGAALAEDKDKQIQLIYAPWTKFCLKGQEANAKQVCFTGKDGRIESGQPVVAAVVIEPDGDPKKILRVTLPLGMQIKHGTRIVIDNDPPQQAPYVICFANGCMADYDATPALIASMRKSQNLVVQAINANGAPLTLPLPLGEFAKAYDGAPTDPKVFEATQKKLQEELAARAAAKKGQSSTDVATISSTSPASQAIAAPASAPQMQAAAPIPNLVAPAGRRVALIMGNSAYKFMPTLQNPRNDAADVDAALKSLGFETVMVTDLDRAGMNAAVDKFSRMVQGASVAVVYYSGHGMQFNGKNYLLPVDADLQTAADVTRYRLLPVDDLTELMAGAGGLQLVVLDACRNNLVERDFKNKIASAAGGNRDAFLTRGFARVDGRSGLIMAYSTAPNEVAADGDGRSRNSPFTKAFLSNIMAPDVDIRQLLFRVQNDVYKSSDSKQLPEISSFYVGPEVRLKTSQK